MCLIVFAYKVLPGHPLVLAGNRDEFYNRPAEPAHMWDTSPGIIAGKDLKAGGTWLGISMTGRFAALTNYRKIDEIKENAPSRGNIIKDFLVSDETPQHYLHSLQETAGNYNGFNLIAGTAETLWYINNKTKKAEEVKPGFHAISNAFLDTPWPKTEDALRAFKKTILTIGVEEEPVFSILMADKTYPENKLPETGLTRELEKAVSAIFIKTEGYGTRCSTMVTISNDGRYTLTERTFKPGTQEVEGDVSHSFTLSDKTGDV